MAAARGDLDDLAGVAVDRLRLGLGRVDLLDVGAVPAVLDDDELAVRGVLAQHAVARDGRVDELLRLRGRELVRSEVLRDVHPTRIAGRIRRVGDLEVRAVLAEAQRGDVADGRRVEGARVDLAEVVDDVAQPDLVSSEPK